MVDKIENHPINQIYNHGVSMSVNTDAKTISNVTLSSEYHLLNQVFKWDLVNFKKCNLEAIKHSFASDEVKRKISKLIQASY